VADASVESRGDLGELSVALDSVAAGVAVGCSTRKWFGKINMMTLEIKMEIDVFFVLVAIALCDVAFTR
jgi:hypothetical protein